MKTTTTLVSALATAGAALAAPVDPRFPDSGPFKMIVLAYEQPIHYSYVEASGGLFYIGKDTNSTCGNVEPILNGGNGALSTYADDLSNAQQVFVDISGAADGLLSYTGPLYSSLPGDAVHDQFSRVAGEDISQLYYEDGNWLACPTTTDGEYLVYAEKAWAKPVGKDQCIPFEIRTDKVDNPEACKYL